MECLEATENMRKRERERLSEARNEKERERQHKLTCAKGGDQQWWRQFRRARQERRRKKCFELCLNMWELWLVLQADDEGVQFFC